MATTLGPPEHRGKRLFPIKLIALSYAWAHGRCGTAAPGADGCHRRGGHVRAAGGRAARLHTTTVSQQIAALEKSVGGPVFERPRGPRPVWITPHGAVVLLEQGRDLLAKVEALADAVEWFKVGDGRTDIGTLSWVRARVGSSSDRPARNPPSPRLITPQARQSLRYQHGRSRTAHHPPVDLSAASLAGRTNPDKNEQLMQRLPRQIVRIPQGPQPLVGRSPAGPAVARGTGSAITGVSLPHAAADPLSRVR
jgi:DNA-binding transcriptional LysR family regulator